MNVEDLARLEPYVRFGGFGSALAVMMLAETVWPQRARVRPRLSRWRTNALLVAAGTLAARALAMAPAPLAAGAAAIWASTNGVGLFNMVAIPPWAGVGVGMIALDLVVWAQHWAFHRFALLWAFHRVHHGDRDVDATTALRFHPIEILLSALLKAAAAIALGAPLAAVILFEVLLNACAIFNHANTSLPPFVERIGRCVLITPDLHRIHHSQRPDEHNSNYGFCLSSWDWLFGTLRRRADAGAAPDVLGLSDLQDSRPELLSWSLMSPFDWRRR